jgi:hypothetical protein
MDLGEVGWSDVDWIGLAQDKNRWRALANSVLLLSNGLQFDGPSLVPQLITVHCVRCRPLDIQMLWHSAV